MSIAYIQEYNNIECFGNISLYIFKSWLVFMISNLKVPKIYARDAKMLMNTVPVSVSLF